jgi:hypothetical protein|tara:strand:+ start:213 stop:395 length:183 start_codon:yes stop_codon:yes gene_type:complete
MKESAISEKSSRKVGFQRHPKHRHQLGSDGQPDAVIEQFYDWLDRHGHRAANAPGLAIRD